MVEIRESNIEKEVVCSTKYLLTNYLDNFFEVL